MLTETLFSDRMLAIRQGTHDDKVMAPVERVASFSWLDRHGGRTTTIVTSVVFVLLYVTLDTVTFVFPFEPFPVTPWNPNAGLAIAIIVAGGRRYVPAVLFAALISEVPLLSERVSLIANVFAGLGLGAAYAATALAVRHFAPRTTLERLRDLRLFLIAVVTGTAVSAACYVQFNLPPSGVPAGVHFAAFLRMWLGDLTGTIAIAPLMFLVDRSVGGREGASPRAAAMLGWIIDVTVFLLVLGALMGLIFGLEPIEGHKLFYLLFVPLIALAMKRGYDGAAIGTAIVQTALIGVLVVTDRSAQSASEFQLLMLVLALTTLLLGAVASERRRALVEVERRSVELRTQQSALADALRIAAASEMASALAHELAQPLSAIGTYARAGLEMLRLGTAQPADLARALERVEKETVRSGKTVRRIRDFFRSGASQLELVDVGALISETAATLQDYADERTTLVEVDVESQLPRIFADRVQVGTVLHNLLTNAIDATFDGAAPARVVVKARMLSVTSIAIDVIDTGPGVAASVRGSLFEPLATTKPTGMGLGLAISKTIVEAHGGHLALLDGQPTIFRIVLPNHVDANH